VVDAAVQGEVDGEGEEGHGGDSIGSGPPRRHHQRSETISQDSGGLEPWRVR
jgi:hypothetical protein